MKKLIKNGIHSSVSSLETVSINIANVFIINITQLKYVAIQFSEIKAFGLTPNTTYLLSFKISGADVSQNVTCVTFCS